MTRPSATAAALRLSPRRTLGLARANAVLVTRNRMTLFYAVVLPLLPLGLLLVGDTGDGGPAGAGAAAIVTALMMAAIFPVYYNLLSQLVTRRDELVLKRLRTGESTDAEIVVSLALPGVVVALAGLHAVWALTGAALLLRVVGDFRYVGLCKRVRGTRFAARDTRVYTPLCYTPLCAVLAAGVLSLAF